MKNNYKSFEVLFTQWAEFFFADFELKMGYGPTIKGCPLGCKQKFELHRRQTEGGSPGL